MRKLRFLGLLLVPAVLLCGCAKTEQQQTESLVDEWLADKDAQTEPVTVSADSIDDGATPLSSFEYTIREDGTAAILNFTGTETNVVVTSHIGDAPVTEIGQYAFEAAWDVQRIVLPETVTVIGEQAFLDCSSLTAVNIPTGVQVLQRATFAGCSALTDFTIPGNIKETYEELFSGCCLTDVYVENPELPYVSWGLEEIDPPCTIHAPEGAVILQWAEEQGLPVKTGEFSGC